MLRHILTIVGLLALFVVFVWYPWFSERMERDMRAFLQAYATYQEAELINNETYASSVGGSPLRIPEGLEILVVSASPTAHAAVTRPRYGYPRVYCALWVGPTPEKLAPRGPDDPMPRGDRTSGTLCDEPTRFEAWLEGSRR